MLVLIEWEGKTGQPVDGYRIPNDITALGWLALLVPHKCVLVHVYIHRLHVYWSLYSERS